MRLRPFVRACVGAFALAAAPGLAAQLSPSSLGGLDGGMDAGAVAAVPPLSVEAAAAAAGVPLFDPRPAVNGFTPWFLDDVDRVMEDALADGAAPGAAVVVGHRGRIVLAKGWGRIDPAHDAPAVTDSTLWDLASVTKTAATTVAAMLLVQDGRLSLDEPIHTYLPEWPAAGARGGITVRELLHHTSGMPAGAPVGKGGRDGLIARLAELPLEANPGQKEQYGDLDMVLAGAVIEAVAGEPLDRLVRRRVYDRLGMAETTFRPLDAGIPRARIAPTEKLGASPLQGIVHDPIARDLGGVSGNAGLFASARDLATLASALLWEAPDRVVCRAVVDEFTKPVWGDEYALGWETGAPGTMWGEIFTRWAYGHVGYTGTSLWIDPKLDVFVILLTNRVNPSARNQKHLELRFQLHDTVRRGLEDVFPGGDSEEPSVRDGCLAERVAEGLRRLPPIPWPR